jgi:hypothetical protein
MAASWSGEKRLKVTYLNVVEVGMVLVDTGVKDSHLDACYRACMEMDRER